MLRWLYYLLKEICWVKSYSIISFTYYVALFWGKISLLINYFRWGVVFPKFYVDYLCDILFSILFKRLKVWNQMEGIVGFDFWVWNLFLGKKSFSSLGFHAIAY